MQYVLPLSSSPNAENCLLTFALCLLSGSLDDAQDVVLSHDQVLFIVQFDFGTRVFAEQNPVALLHIHLDSLTGIELLACSDSNHFALLRLFLGAVGNDYPPANLFSFLNSPDDYSVLKWLNAGHFVAPFVRFDEVLKPKT